MGVDGCREDEQSFGEGDEHGEDLDGVSYLREVSFSTCESCNLVDFYLKKNSQLKILKD